MTSDTKKIKKGFSRRKFMVRSVVGVGVLVGTGYLTRPLWRRSIAHLVDTSDGAAYLGNTKSPSLWFEVTADNQVILHSPKVEMGQGTFTGLAQIAADELEIGMDQIRVIHAATASGNVDPISTGGSTSIAGLWQPLRELAATMREMLKMEAAKQLGVDVSSLRVENGIVSGNGQSLSYGEIVKEVQEWTVPDTPTLKEIKSYKYVGQPVPRVDLNDKVLGAPIFGMDATMPDMLYGAVARPSQIGAKFKSAHTEKAEQMPGVVQVVVEPDFVGVVAQSRMEAELAKNALEVEWETDKVWQSEDIEAMIKVGAGTPFVIQKQGRAKRILDNEAGVITAEFT
ncbi:MAG: molybdopterin-dependent oxidoreductase, partial [Phaeodactylibacter sp.]|nr:molybdopterin-dependent oxidoreductase [Phaeodactylibacter sp.]